LVKREPPVPLFLDPNYRKPEKFPPINRRKSLLKKINQNGLTIKPALVSVYDGSMKVREAVS